MGDIGGGVQTKSSHLGLGIGTLESRGEAGTPQCIPDSGADCPEEGRSSR